MKRILITGQNSYIGNSFEEWVAQWPENYKVDKISLRDNRWKSDDWSQYDSILHVAGIAHNSSDKSLEDLYYSVNRDLTEEVASKAKHDGVKQFIYMSSMIIFGASEVIDGVITSKTIPIPANFYGDSKFQGENVVRKLDDQNFKIVIIRPPMVYGKNSKGNYPLLVKLAKITPIFPNYDNKRSMIYIDNLTEFIKLIIQNENEGTYHPQNKELINTSQLVKEIALIYGKKIYLVKFANPLIKILINKINILHKVFGNQIYAKELSEYGDGDYQINDFIETIQKSEQ